jgi:hypothetical protein
MARLEFGKNYPRGSLPDKPAKSPRKKVVPPKPDCESTTGSKMHIAWRPPSVRERRCELEAGKARLLRGRKRGPEDDANLT